MVSNMFLNAAGESNTTTWIFVALLVVLVVVLLVVPMFTNKKRAKQTTELHNSLRPGDVVKTVGGIIGTIKEVRQVSPVDKEMVLETGEGDNKTTMVFDIQALYQIVSRASEPAAQTAVANEYVDEVVADSAEKHEEPVVAAPETAETPVAEPATAPVEEKPEEVAEPVADVEQAAATEDKPETDTAAKPKATSAPKKKPINSKNSAKK